MRIGPHTPLKMQVGESRTFLLVGKSFFNITNVYLSGNSYPNSTFYNPFSGVPLLSASYPGFFGVKLLSSSFVSNNDNRLTFTVPPPSLSGVFDIILENEAGWGSLLQFTIRTTYNPYMPGSQEYNEYVPFLPAWTRGIVVEGISTTPSNQIYGINGDILVTIDGSNIVNI